MPHSRRRVAFERDTLAQVAIGGIIIPDHMHLSQTEPPG